MMFELYKSEFLRLRKGALVAFLIFIFAYYLLPRFGLWDILHRNMGFLLTVGVVITSLVFGVLHGILWRHKNFWFFLLHRPLSPAKVGVALIGAGLTVLVASVFMSLFVTTLGYDLLTAKVVDGRHYEFVVYLTLVSFACYLMGTVTVLNRSKFVILAFYALFAVFFPQPINALAQYLPLAVLLVALVYLNLQCFKPDLEKPVRAPLAASLMAAGTGYGLTIGLLLFTTVIYHLPLLIMDKHPDTNPVEGTLPVIWKDNLKQGVAYALAESDHPRATHYANQASLAEPRYLPNGQWQPPRRGQFHRFDNKDALWDVDNGASWKFSHDQMLLVGIDPYTQQSLGAIGRNGWVSDLSAAGPEDRFIEVPHLSGNRFVSTRQALFVIDFAARALILKHRVSGGEYYTSSLWVGRDAAMISTNNNLLIFDLSTLNDDYSELYVDYRVALPPSAKQAESSYGFKVADGFVLLFFGQNYFGFDRPGAEAYIARLDGSFEALGGREFNVHEHPSWVRHYNFMVAPVISITEELLMHSIDPFEPRFLNWSQIKSQRYPGSVYVMAGGLQIASVLMLWWLIRRAQGPAALRRMWMVLVATLGLPALLSYLLLHRER